MHLVGWGYEYIDSLFSLCYWAEIFAYIIFTSVLFYMFVHKLMIISNKKYNTNIVTAGDINSKYKFDRDFCLFCGH